MKKLLLSLIIFASQVYATEQKSAQNEKYNLGVSAAVNALAIAGICNAYQADSKYFMPSITSYLAGLSIALNYVIQNKNFKSEFKNCDQNKEILKQKEQKKKEMLWNHLGIPCLLLELYIMGSFGYAYLKK